MHIHLVEDNPDMLESLRMLLELRGFSVKAYLRGLDLLDRIDAIGDDDIIVSDYYLPDINGIELVKRVQQRHGSVCALFLTGSREQSIVKAAAAVPRSAVLYKPLAVEALEEGIRALKQSAACTAPASAAGARLSVRRLR
jgi:DNA-binding response OmpR family regulator